MTFDFEYRNTQSKYIKLFKNKNGNDNSILQNEIRIKGSLGNTKKYVDYGIELLSAYVSSNNSTTDSTSSMNSFGNDNNDSFFSVDGGSNNGRYSNSINTNDDDTKWYEGHNVKCTNYQTIVLKATGHAINKAVLTAEIIKRRVPGLHQKIKCDTVKIIDEWEPIEEGLNNVKVSRFVASMEITLSLDDNKIEKMKHSIGYQKPISLNSIYSINTKINNNIIINPKTRHNKNQNKKKKKKKNKKNKNISGNVNGNGSVNVGMTYKNPKSDQQHNNIRVDNTFGYTFAGINNTHIIRSQSGGEKSGKTSIGNNDNNNSDGY